MFLVNVTCPWAIDANPAVMMQTATKKPPCRDVKAIFMSMSPLTTVAAVYDRAVGKPELIGCHFNTPATPELIFLALLAFLGRELRPECPPLRNCLRGTRTHTAAPESSSSEWLPSTAG